MRTNLLNDLSNVLKKGASMNLLPKMDREWIGNDSRMDRQSLGKIFRYAAMITLLLTLACGEMWAGQECYEIYMVYEFNGTTTGRNYTYKKDDDATNPVVSLGNLTSNTFKIKEVYWKTKDDWRTHKINAYGWYNMGAGDTKFAEYDNYTGSNTDPEWDGKEYNDHEIQNTNVNYTVATANTGNSGTFTFSHWWRVNFHYNNDGYSEYILANKTKNYNFTFNILPPNATAITATPTGAVSGSGTEGDPYIVPYGGNLTIALSGSDKARADDNSSVQYSVDGGESWGTSSKIFSNVTATSTQNWVFKARCYNSTASLASPSETTKTVYYKAAYGVPVYKFVVNTGVGKGNVCATDNTDYPQTVANSKLSTLIGGTLTARGNGTESHLKYDDNAYNFNGANFYLKVVTENPLKTGDVIRYKNRGASNSSVAVRLTEGNTSNELVLAGNGTSDIQTVVVTSAFNNQNTFYIDRKANTSYLEYFEIIRPYVVTLDASTNGGKVGGKNTATMYFAANEAQALPHATKSGYRFKGWFTTSGGSSEAANPYTATASTTLYAQFEDCPTGEATVYKFQFGTGLTNGTTGKTGTFDINKGNYLSSLIGGTLTGYDSNGAKMSIVSNSAIKINDKSNAYLQVDLDCAIQSGDVIKTTITGTGDYYIATTSGGSSVQALSAGTEQSVVVPAALVGRKQIFLKITSNNDNSISYFEIYRPEACTEITPTWSTDYTSTTLNVGGTSSTPVVGKDGSSGALSYSSSDTQIATVNSSGVVTAVKTGSATITATVAAAGGKCEGTVTKDFTIKAGVTYNGNSPTSGSVPTDANTYAANANVTIAGNTGSLVKTGKIFTGWNTKADGTGTHYDVGATMKMPEKSAGVTLYAHWVGYAESWEWWNSGQSNDGTTFTYVTSKNYSCSFASLGNKDKACWDMTGGVLYRGIKLKQSGAQISFWVQTGKNVSITFGYRAAAPNTFTVGGVDKKSDVPSSTTDSLTKTYTTSADTKFVLKTGSDGAFCIKRVLIEDDVETFTLTNAVSPTGYGTVSPTSVTDITSGTTTSSSTNTYTVNGTTVTATPADATAEYTYAFSSWSNLPATVTEDAIVTATFTRTANNYTLAWSSNGGSELSGDYTSGSTAYGASITAPTDPTKSNYTFDGWNTANDGSGSAAAATMPAEDVTYYAAWKQTVTLTTGAQGEGGNQTPYVYLNGTAVSSFTAHTADGYTLEGYYTAESGGTKVLNADGTFAGSNVTDYITSGKWSRTGAAPTLYAQWVASEDCRTLKYVWKVTGNFCDDQSTATSAVSMISENDYFTLSGTGYKQESGKSLNLQNTQNNYFLLTAKTGYQIKSICFYGKVQDSSVDFTTDGSSWSALASTKTDGDKYYTFDDIDASAFGIKLTAATPSGIWIRNMVIEVCASGDVTYNVTYDDNGKTGGSVPSDATNYSYGGTVIVKGNTGELAKTNYTFAGWTTNNDGTGSSYVEDNTFSITANTTLYAKWTQAVTFDANTTNHGSTGGSATAVWNATGLTGITHATPASGYKLLGYYTTASGDGTKVLNADGTFASTSVTGYITDGKWTQNSSSTPKLYARYELAGGIVTNTLKVGSNKWGSTISTSEPTHIRSLNALAAVGGLTIDGGNGTTSGETALTAKVEASGATSKTDAEYLQLSFTIDPGYRLRVTGINAWVRSVSNNRTYYVEITGTTGSITKTTTVNESVSAGANIFADQVYDVTFTGTVTMKIWAYSTSTQSSNLWYRLASPISIYGSLEETCTMPSYSSVTYTKTEYTVSETSSAITVTSPSDVTGYQWKYNSTGDRTSGTNADAVGTGATTESFTPSTSVAHEKRYYWCELTNACGTIKTEAVGVTVSTSKSTATVTWSNPGTVNYGGGGYTLRATVEQSAWDGTASDLTITAPAGINIYGVTSGTDGSNKKYVEVTFDVQTSFDRSTYAENIPFTVSAAATTNYNAISNEHDVAYVACSGGGAGTDYNIRVRKTYDKNAKNIYRWVTAGAGEITTNVGSSIGSAKADKVMATVFDSTSSSTAEYVWVMPYEAGIKKMRLWSYVNGANCKLLEVYKSTSYEAAADKNKITSSCTIEYEDDGEDTGAKGNHYIDVTFGSDLSANDVICFKLTKSRFKPAGVIATTSGGGASINTGLTWSSGTADGGSVTGKTQSSANFTITATRDAAATVSLGAITYSSSNTSCATVDSETGEVTITASGTSDLSTTIKATLAASGCYKKKEITYTLTIPGVTCMVTTGTLTSDVTSKCSTADATLTLTGFESGASIQWYNGETPISNVSPYAITTVGTTSTLVTQEEGTYSVTVTNATCSDRSNSITISNKSTSVSAERDVKTWYVKNGRMTPDIELWSLSEGTHLSSVAFTRSDAGDATAIGLSNSDVYESDGKVYLKGTAPSANSTGSDIAYTLTLTVTDECNNTTTLSASDKQITLYHQKNTDKHVVAFVVTGTEKGGFTEGVPSNQTTEIDLYKTIAAEFDVVATNVYSTDDEQAIKEYYSQFDILCVTDYPDTNTKGAKKQSYVNALGSLIDIRPILTMEAFVAKWSNWAAKGISGTPKSPDPKQYAMDLQCKDHEIFDGTDWSTVGTGDEMMYRVTMVSSTSYPSKPALQGFTFDATMVADGLLPLGQIYNGSTETLQVGIERQNEMAARLMVLGINSVAMERLTDDGQRVVINALKYLMKKNEEDIADCSVSFVGGAEEGSKTDWNNDANWSTGKRPDKTTREVRILAPCVITDGQTITSPTIKIADGGTYDGGTKADGKLTINAGGVLKVKGEVVGVTAPAYSKKKATEASRLELETSASKQSALILKNENGMTRATVNFYSLGRTTDKYQFQYMAIPMEYVDIHPAFSGKGIYTYVYHEATGWERRGYYSYLEAFEGVGITTKFTEARTYTMTGTLASTEEREITLTKTAEKNGDNLIGNSWTAPIQISELEKAETTATLASKTVYIYCAGHDGASVEYGTTETPGQWLAIPFNAAGFSGWTGLKVIPAMNAFELMATTGGTITLNYDTLVRGGELLNLTEKARTPRRMASHEGIELTRIRVSDTKTHTDLHLFEGDGFSEEFDDGWEAEYMEGDGISAQFYAVNGDNKMAVLADQSLEGTVLGFAPGQELTYTFSFAGEDNGYYLNDIKLETATPINEAETYTFTYEEGDTNRFYISRTAINAPQVTTGMGNTGDGVKAKKILYNDKLYIIVNGRVYSADGAIVK